MAAASDIDPALFRQTGQVKIDPANSSATVQRYTHSNDPDLHITGLAIQNNVIRVQGWVQIKPVFLSLFGVSAFRLNVTGRARPAFGVNQAGQ